MLIIIEGVDRSGKSTLVKELEKNGFKSIHFSAPDKKFYQQGYTGPTYAESLVELMVGLSGQNVVFDRSHYGEIVWSQVYNRRPALSLDEIQLLRELEGEDVRRIVMHDPDIHAHWARCVANKEPLTQVEFAQARNYFYNVADTYGFEVKTISDIPQIVSEILGEKQPSKSTISTADSSISPNVAVTSNSEGRMEESRSTIASENETPTRKNQTSLTSEQLKLAQANAINEVMSSRLVKKKGEIYDVLESKIRSFLNDQLAILLGTSRSDNSFSEEDVIILKALAQKVKDKK